ncbi:MAG TPA: hypothetical protein VIV12_30105 [Streptosporangiaceae bacterium]
MQHPEIPNYELLQAAAPLTRCRCGKDAPLRGLTAEDGERVLRYECLACEWVTYVDPFEQAKKVEQAVVAGYLETKQKAEDLMAGLDETDTVEQNPLSPVELWRLAEFLRLGVEPSVIPTLSRHVSPRDIESLTRRGATVAQALAILI